MTTTISWMNSLAQALEAGRKEEKPLLIDFFNPN